MKSGQRQETTKRVSFLQLFRLVFVLFSLYLLRSAFYRWDGFKFYASFSEFIPSVALVSIFWTIAAIITTVLIWILCRSLEWLSDRIGLKISTEHILLYGTVSILIGALVWKSKRLLWPDIQTGHLLKFGVLMFVVLLSAYLVWVLRNKAEHWFEIIQERITPLIWLFGIFVILSVPLIGFYTWGKVSDKPIPQKITQSTVSKSDKKSPNILLVTFDTLTARDMSLYGYHRKTTPFISKWAKGATVFTKAKSENNHTTPTTASLMTGKMVWTHQVYQQAGSISVGSDIESLPKVLKDNGYFNLAFVVNPFASTKKLGVFNSFDITPLATEFYQTDDIVILDPYQYGLIGVLLYKVFGDKIRLHDWIIDGKFFGLLQPIISPKFKTINPKYTKTAVPPAIAYNRFFRSL